MVWGGFCLEDSELETLKISDAKWSGVGSFGFQWTQNQSDSEP